jgi:Domain of unknown function (DUF4902)
MRLRNTPYEYVQIAESDLPRIQLRHLSSAIDPSISLPESLAEISDVLTGYTEWTGRWQAQGLTIGWDWAFSNERILLIHAGEIRSNIQVIGKDGAPASAMQTRQSLAAWIETLPWRDDAVSQLVQRNRRPAP